MKQFSKIICIALVLVIAFSTTAFAATTIDAPEVDPNKETRDVTVTAKVNEAVPGQQVTILVLPASVDLGKGISDSDVAYVDQAAANAEGTAEFKFNIPESKGNSFVAYVGGTNVASAKSASLYMGKNGPGDADGTGVVDLDDYFKLLGIFGQRGGVAGSTYDAMADFDSNNVIDLDDYFILLANFGNRY